MADRTFTKDGETRVVSNNTSATNLAWRGWREVLSASVESPVMDEAQQALAEAKAAEAAAEQAVQAAEAPASPPAA